MSTSKKPKYVQRSLEDQIAEEWAEKTLDKYRQEHKEELKKEFDDMLIYGKSSLHFKTNHLKTESMSDTQAQAAPVVKKQVKISEVIDLLNKGYVRLTKFDKGGGSIQAHFGLSVSQVKEVFENPKLKGKKSKVQSVSVIDDAPEVVPTIIKPKTPKVAKAVTDADLFK